MSARPPTRDEVRAAQDRLVPDIIAPGLRVLFSGINPSLYSAAVGHHFARPGNRFWPTMFRAEFTPRLFHPAEGERLLELGYGITNIVARATAAADELGAAEFVAGGRIMAAKVAELRPQVVAFLGITAYRAAFGRPHARVGPQPERLAGAILWALPNPSGRNGHFAIDPYRDLKAATDLPAEQIRRDPAADPC